MTKLIDAPVGLLMYDGCLFLKTEYLLNGMPECYIVESGEIFCGGVTTPKEINDLEVEVVDAALVAHGHWEVTDWVEYDGHSECVHHPKEGLWCSNCKHCFREKLLWERNFCPSCGARMDETEDDKKHDCE